jgi:ABC-2 type transport system permease protein
VKSREIFRFELSYQARLVRTWLYFAVLLVVAYLLTGDRIEAARDDGTFANSPFAIASGTVITNVLWLLMAPAVAGSAAARDVQTRMHPLVYTTPIRKLDYLGGRWLAALLLNAAMLVMVPLGMLLAVFVPGLETGILAPFRPPAYFTAYAFIALPTAFAVTAIQFSLAALCRRAVVSYLGSVLGIALAIVSGVVREVLGKNTLGTLLDPLGYFTVLGFLTRVWTQTEKDTLLVGLQRLMITSRIFWIAIGLGVLTFTHWRFRFEDGADGARSKARSVTA